MLDRRALVTLVAADGHPHDRRVKNMPAPSDVALPREIAAELAEQRLGHTGLLSRDLPASNLGCGEVATTAPTGLWKGHSTL